MRSCEQNLYLKYVETKARYKMNPIRKRSMFTESATSFVYVLNTIRSWFTRRNRSYQRVDHFQKEGNGCELDLSKTSEIGSISTLITSYEFSWYRLYETLVIIWVVSTTYTSNTIVKGIAVSGLRNSIQRMISLDLRCGQRQWDSVCFRTSLSC